MLINKNKLNKITPNKKINSVKENNLLQINKKRETKSLLSLSSVLN